eukprot:TRINITY_DN26318_c0_g1_i1.p1 TRINITY_DN26318_c0_g1~~TRINITY_DN26318_c0_g1_i1.p1  ORF type:complete len:623 (-),score=218.99 TRINITY_DN26318_c0_g1_i1:27-1895(-)
MFLRSLLLFCMVWAFTSAYFNIEFDTQLISALKEGQFDDLEDGYALLKMSQKNEVVLDKSITQKLCSAAKISQNSAMKAFYAVAINKALDCKFETNYEALFTKAAKSKKITEIYAALFACHEVNCDVAAWGLNEKVMSVLSSSVSDTTETGYLLLAAGKLARLAPSTASKLTEIREAFRSIVPNIDVDDVCGTSRILSGLHSVASATKKPLKKGSKVFSSIAKTLESAKMDNYVDAHCVTVAVAALVRLPKPVTVEVENVDGKVKLVARDVTGTEVPATVSVTAINRVSAPAVAPAFTSRSGTTKASKSTAMRQLQPQITKIDGDMTVVEGVLTEKLAAGFYEFAVEVSGSGISEGKQTVRGSVKGSVAFDAVSLSIGQEKVRHPTVHEIPSKEPIAVSQINTLNFAVTVVNALDNSISDAAALLRFVHESGRELFFYPNRSNKNTFGIPLKAEEQLSGLSGQWTVTAIAGDKWAKQITKELCVLDVTLPEDFKQVPQPTAAVHPDYHYIPIPPVKMANPLFPTIAISAILFLAALFLLSVVVYFFKHYQMAFPKGMNLLYSAVFILSHAAFLATCLEFWLETPLLNISHLIATSMVMMGLSGRLLASGMQAQKNAAEKKME